MEELGPAPVFEYFGDLMGYLVVSVFGTAAIAFAVLSRYATDLRYLGYLAFGLLSCGTGFLLQTARTPADLAANALLATAFYFAGALLVAEAVQRRSSDTMGRAFHAVVLVVALLATSYFLFIDRNLLARTYILNFGFGLVLLAAAWKKREHIGGSDADRILFWTMALVGMHFFPRTLLTAGSFSAAPGEHVTTAFWVTLQYTLAIIANVGALALVGVAGADIFTTITRERDTDALTGLLNRRGIEAAIRPLVAKGTTGAVILADLDSFKAINDRFGHAAGDQVLQEVAYRLAKVTRKQDLLGRIGGEEFLCVIEGNLEDAFGLAERLRTTLAAEPVHAGSARLTITASFGIAGFDSRDNFWDAVKNADAQLYAAKRAGKNVVALKGETPGPARLPECRFPATAHTSRAFKLRPPG